MRRASLKLPAVIKGKNAMKESLFAHWVGAALPAVLLAAWVATAAALPASASAAEGRLPPGVALPRAASPESVGFSTERLRRLDRWMEGEIAAGRKSGVVVLVARHGKIAWEKSYGVADITSRAPLRTDAMFRLFSMTKPITSVALLTLYEQGKFQLSDPLERFIPAFAGVGVYAGADAAGHPIITPPKRKVTIQDVFRHTAGFAYSAYFESTPVDLAYKEAGIDYQKLDSLDELVSKLARMPLLYEPGERWVYSWSYDVLAYLVEQLSGQRFDEYCRRTIFEPLGMRDTVFGMPEDRAARFPTAYHGDAAGALVAYTRDEDSYPRFTTHPFGGASVASTAEDYLRFAQMLLNGGELNGVRILAPKTVELMRSDNLPPGTDYWTPGQRFGLGVSVLTDPAQAGILGSKGQYAGSGLATTWFTVDPAQDLVAIVMTQFVPRVPRFEDQFHVLVYQALLEAPTLAASAQHRVP
jgi:CubicO group peptidase (beta-lactamase class C family)